MNPIVAQRQLLRQILDEVLRCQSQVRYESPHADPVYLKIALARALVGRHPKTCARPSIKNRDIAQTFSHLTVEGHASIAQLSVTDPEGLARNNCTYRLSQAGRCPKSNATFFAFRNFATDHRWSTVT
jgi:hypothetical protein